MMDDHFTNRNLTPSLNKSEFQIEREEVKNIQDTIKRYRGGSIECRRQMDMSSQLQGSEFYERVLKIDRKERPTSDHQLVVNNLHSINLKDFEKDFTKRG
jgi:hypothetical protein